MRGILAGYVAACALVAGASPARAQAPADTARTPRAARPEPPDARYWSFILIPLPTFNTIEGLGVALVGGWTFPAKPGRIPSGFAITPVAHLSWSGTKGVGLQLDAPGYVRGWRFYGLGMAERWNRMPYFGLGNGSDYSDSLYQRYGDEYYAYSLSRLTAIAKLQRDLVGPFRLHFGAQWHRYSARPLTTDTTLLGNEVAAGLPRDTGSSNGIELRAGLLLDTRDEEASPSRGLFLEAMAAQATGKLDYRRYLFSAREFLPLGWTKVLALRQSVELSEGHIPHYVAQERLTTWLPEDGFGGPTTLRGNLLGRWVAPNKALASIELRYKKWDYPVTETTPIRLWLLLFADAGRLWGDGERFQWRHWHTGYGSGVRLQFSRGAIFGLDAGWGPDSGINFATAFSFGF